MASMCAGAGRIHCGDVLRSRRRRWSARGWDFSLLVSGHLTTTLELVGGSVTGGSTSTGKPPSCSGSTCPIKAPTRWYASCDGCISLPSSTLTPVLMRVTTITGLSGTISLSALIKTGAAVCGATQVEEPVTRAFKLSIIANNSYSRSSHNTGLSVMRN